jgi:predicted RNase H-like HicB family nuclease
LSFYNLKKEKWSNNMMKQIDYIIWQEGKYFVSQCLNVNVSSFGKSIDEAAKNLKEAVELYFEGETIQLPQVNNIFIGREQVNV